MKTNRPTKKLRGITTWLIEHSGIVNLIPAVSNGEIIDVKYGDLNLSKMEIDFVTLIQSMSMSKDK